MKLRRNENVLKITGSACIERPLNISDDYEIIIKGTCQSSSQKNLDDGTYDETWKVKMATAEIKQERERPILSKDRRKESQKTRITLQSYWEFLGCPDDFEEFYE